MPERRLAVIPARSGSKRVPGKNVRDLLGRPALAYTVDAALESGLFERVVVSTDSPAIARIAEACGAETPFLRAAPLADDHTPVSAVTLDALSRLDPEVAWCTAVAQLMPNCPLRTAADVVASWEAFRVGGAESQLSVTRFGWLNPWWAQRRGRDGSLAPLFPEAAQARSQDLDDLVCLTGAIWWTRPAALRRSGTFHLPGRTGWELPWHRAVDVDTEDDWTMAEWLLERAGRGEAVHGR